MVRVPFPCTGAEACRHRPTLVVATAGSGPEPFLLWVLMITSAANRGWSGDVAIPDAKQAGLPPATLAALRAEIAHRLGLSRTVAG